MGAKRTICAQIVEQKGNYVILRRGHQGTAHTGISTYFSDPCLINQGVSFKENDKGHGKIEQGTAYF